MKIAFCVATHLDEQSWWGTLFAKSMAPFDYEKTKIVINNKDGLSTVYNNAIDQTDADILVLCHGDVFIQHPELLESQLSEAMEQFDIVGLAGVCDVQNLTPGAWHLMGNRLSGRVSHTKNGNTWLTEFGETPAEVSILDGLFMALKMSAIRAAGLRFDEQFKFDHYDLDFCLAARKLGLKIGTWPIDVIHAGMGERVLGNPSWKESNERFLVKWRPKQKARSADRLLQIAYFAKDKGGCDYYRAMLPLDTLFEQRLANVTRLEKGDDSDRIGEALLYTDVVVFPRMAMSFQMLELVRELKSYGKLIVTDYDDWIWSVNPLSPHYVHYGQAEYQYPLNGDLVDVWTDGEKGFSIVANQKRLAAARQAIEMSGVVTTTSVVLAEKLRQFNPNVAVLPNCVDLARWKPVPLKPHDDVRIFWAGGSSHFEDLQIVDPVMQVIMQRFPQVTFVLMGVKFEALLKHLPAGRVEFHPWEDNLSYPYKCAMLGADLAIIPLVENEFNRSKSAIKWIEQSALGVPCVMSGVTPYLEMYDGENAALVADNSTDAWIRAISTLITEPLLRARIGGEAQRTVREQYDIRKRASDWLRVYEAEFAKLNPGADPEEDDPIWQSHKWVTQSG